MPEQIGIFGSGMTAEACVRVDLSDRDDFAAFIQAANESHKRTSFCKIADATAATATAILEQAGLPFDASEYYRPLALKKWSVVDLSTVKDPYNEVLLDLAGLVHELGFSLDSPEGYAARALCLLDDYVRLIFSRSYDEAQAAIHALGCLTTEAGLKDLWDAAVIRGERVRKGGEKGAERAHGTRQERAVRHGLYVTYYEQMRLKGMRSGDAYRATVKKFGVERRTIERAVAAAKQ